ncbi:helix-turn-helix domain-containing protein [Agaribacterium sp. ZY112]|uniref:helix-turn-helix domain-containing protein n=1 Tax=Agaribacterium sp. ZY112 TaxID=3233574 RepID=UPI0035257C6F
MSHKPSKTKTSFFRRIYVAYLIDSGISTVPAIIDTTGMPKRTAQDTITALHELEIQVEFVGATKNGCYQLTDWGAVNKRWVEAKLSKIIEVLEYPELPDQDKMR